MTGVNNVQKIVYNKHSQQKIVQQREKKSSNFVYICFDPTAPIEARTTYNNEKLYRKITEKIIYIYIFHAENHIFQKIVLVHSKNNVCKGGNFTRI